MPRSRRLWTLAASTAAFSGFLWWQQDDFYIHLQYARHLAESGEWSFNAGQPTYGSTSPLWVMLLAALNTIGIDLQFAAKASSLVFAVASVWLLLTNGERIFGDAGIAWCCAASVAANHWYRLAAGGAMEATLCAFLVLWLAIRLVTGDPRIVGAAGGVLAGLIALTRPEFTALPVVVVLLSPASWAQRATFVAGTAAVWVPWGLYAWTTFGTIVANTAIVKALGVAPATAITLGHAWTSAARIVAFYVPTNAVELLGAGALAVFGCRHLLRRRPAEARAPGDPRVGSFKIPAAVWAIVLLIPVTYFVNQLRGGVELSYRYAAPSLPVLGLVGWRGVGRLLEALRTRRRVRALFLACAVACVIVTNVGMTALHFPFLSRSHAYIDGVLADYGRWLEQNAEPAAVVGAYDVGALAYFSRRPVLDLVGLNSPEVIPLRWGPQADALSAAAIRKFRPTYLVTLQEVPLAAYTTVLPAYTVERSALVTAYRFAPSALSTPPRQNPVALLRLHWPSR